MNRTYPFTPTPVVLPLYQPPESASSSPLHSETEPASPSSTKPLKSSSLTSLNHITQNLTLYNQQNERRTSLRNKGMYSKSRHEKEFSDFNAGTYNDDMSLTSEEVDDYKRGNIRRSQYELYRAHNSIEDELQPNIPGAVIDHCSHTTQIFVKVRSMIRSSLNNSGVP